jgi:hypothetical protein
MANSNNLSLFPQEMNVDYGRLLESQIEKWKGGASHIRGISEYISNSDDSYIRLGRSNKIINVEIYSKTGKKISKLIVTDNAEGMDKNDLEKKFFAYYRSYSGRETAKVSGRFGTGGKAYAIMNFQKSWITSVKNGFEHRAWFSWNDKEKKPIYGFDKGGYCYKKVDAENGTTIELINSLKNTIPLEELMIQLCTSSRIRGTIKNQNVQLKIDKKGDVFEDKLDYEGVNILSSTKEWNFTLPKKLNNKDKNRNLTIYYFKEPLKRSQSIIEVSDGNTLFIDLNTSDYDNRPFSKYIYGEVIIEKLYDSQAVKENRKGLEEGDDLTIEINLFLKECVGIVIQEIQDLHREKEKNRVIEVSQKKITELNKFLKKCELNFKKELNTLKKKSLTKNNDNDKIETKQTDDNSVINIYRKPNDDDSNDDLIKGNWIKQEIDESENNGKKKLEDTFAVGPKFEPNEDGSDYAVIIEKSPATNQSNNSSKKGISVIMTDEANSPDAPELHSEFEDPVLDKYLKSDGIILVNVNNPIIDKYRSKKQFQDRFNENIANYVLLIVAQYQTQKEIELQSHDERDDSLINFRRKFFDLQRELREDEEINYFEFDDV